MRVLGIESSCDETGVALYSTHEGLLGHALHSQAEMHAAYGGVVPELASRDHIARVLPLIEDVLRQAQLQLDDIDALAYTRGPGLAGALLVGASVAKALAYALAKPVIGVHHLEGHLLSPLLDPTRPEFPFLALLVSGGHTQLLRVDGLGRYQLLGETLDDAAGEAFDKSAQLLGLGYPGGPAIARMAQRARELGLVDRFHFPRPLLRDERLDFSFAGLKTAVATALRREGPPQDEETLATYSLAIEAAIVEVLVSKTVKAARHTGLKRIVIAGGVGANLTLRQSLGQLTEREGWALFFPPLQWCTDNGAMIALAAALRLQNGERADQDDSINVRPRWPLMDMSLDPNPASVD